MKIWTNGNKNIQTKKGLSLRAIEDNIEDTKDSFNHFVNIEKIEAYAVRIAKERGLISDNYSYERRRRKELLDAISKALGLEKNTLRNSGWGFCSLEGEACNEEDKKQRYLNVARFIGFLSSLESTNERGKLNYPALAAIQARARSGRGHNSPATGMFVHQYAALQFCQSPGIIEKKIWAVKEAALRKHKCKVSFETALRAIGVAGLRVGKAATVATAFKLVTGRNGYICKNFKSYREARAFVADYIKAKAIKPQNLEGVETHLLEKISQKGNISCHKAMWVEDKAVKISWCFFHKVEGYFHQNWGDSPNWSSAIYNFKQKLGDECRQKCSSR